MRKVIVATLALTPMLLHAQANSPAQAQSSGTSTTLQSKLVQPKDLTSSDADHGTAHVATSRISTGVVAPKLISTVQIESDLMATPRGFNLERKTVVAMMVDERTRHRGWLKSRGSDTPQTLRRAPFPRRFD